MVCRVALRSCEACGSLVVVWLCSSGASNAPSAPSSASADTRRQSEWARSSGPRPMRYAVRACALPARTPSLARGRLKNWAASSPARAVPCRMHRRHLLRRRRWTAQCLFRNRASGSWRECRSCGRTRHRNRSWHSRRHRFSCGRLCAASPTDCGRSLPPPGNTPTSTHPSPPRHATLREHARPRDM